MLFMDQTAIMTKMSNKGEPRSQYNPFTSLHDEEEDDYIPTRKVTMVHEGDVLIINGCAEYVEKVYPFMVKLTSGRFLTIGDLVCNKVEPESIIYDKVETKQGWRTKHE